jgi:hypothetical protein
VTGTVPEKTQDGAQAQPEVRDTQRDGRRPARPLPQVATEDSIDIGNGRYAHFRRDRRSAQAQVTFAAPRGVDPNPGRELTDQFKALGWTWRDNEPGKPWTYQLDQSSPEDPAARGDSRDVLHEQFLLIIQEYREKHGMPPLTDWRSPAGSGPKARDAAGRPLAASPVADQAAVFLEAQKPPSEEKETRAGGPRAMLERFDLTLTDPGGEKVAFRGNRPLEQLRSAVPAIVQEAAGRRHNVIVRPRSAGPVLVQLDDLGEAAPARPRPVSFLVLKTSPGNFQAWVAVAEADAGFPRRLREATGADPAASGATRVSGSLNLKGKYAPAFPRVETVHASPGLVVTPAELEALGVVAAPEKPGQTARATSGRRQGRRGWPSYQRCVENAPEAREGGRPDISRPDYTFCLLALDWGWGVEETAARLLGESAKAQENGEAYALRTARNAAAALERRRGARR